jgi:hypothetical protein
LHLTVLQCAVAFKRSLLKNSGSSGILQPTKRKIKIGDDAQSLLNIEFDIDLGLLKRNIPARQLFEEDTEEWDWEQEFSKIAAEFSAQTSKDNSKQPKKEIAKNESISSLPIRL